MEIELIPEDLIATLEGSVERLKVIHRDNPQSALSDDVTEVLQLCMTVEAVLRHMLKEKVSFWGSERRDYWHYFSGSTGELKALDSIIKSVQAQTQFTTGQGRGRALIRECLCEGLLADCIQNAVSNAKKTKEWYHGTAILLSPSLSQRVLTALYDLSEVTFDLPSEGIDLDETWPSFVLKSFDGGPTQRVVVSSAPSPQRKSLFGVLGSGTQEAGVVGKHRGKNKRSILEHAVEEHPTEIFVKHEVPFNLPLVGTLLAEIRCNLIGQCDDHLQSLKNALPELKVDRMDDITSCLTVLSEYMASWGREMGQYQTSIVTELKVLKDKLADLELQLQETLIESETSESNLLSQIQRSRNHLRSCEGSAHHLSSENETLTRENQELKKKVSELETLNFDLEEQLVRSTDEEGSQRKRAYTVLEASLAEKDQDLTDAQETLDARQQELEQLKQQLEQAESQLQGYIVTQETLQHTQATLTSDLEDSKGREKKLEAEIDNLKSTKSQLEEDVRKLKSECESEIVELKRNFDLEFSEIKEQMELESDRCKNVEYERDQVQAELGSMQGLVESETASLRFQISTQAIDLQRARELNKEHEHSLSDYKSKVANLESQLGEVNERCELAEDQIEELKTELQDVEGVLSSNKVELASLSEQLAEKTLSRDLERSQTLRLHTEVEVLSTNLQKEKTDLTQQVEKLNQENEDLRKAFKKLLEQKVTLWQHADKLEQEQVAKGTWINEKTVTECMGCSMTFSVFNRKHHCRSCGKVFCTNCCDKKAQLPFSKDPVRVCAACHEKIQDVRTPMSAKMVNTLDMESLIVSQALGINSPVSGDEDGEGRGSRNSLNISRNVEVNGNSLHARLHHQNVAGSLPSIEDSSSTVSGNNSFRDLTMELAAKYLSPSDKGLDAESLHSVNSTDYVVDPELKQREADKILQNGEDIDTKEGNVRISTVEGDSEDDSYYVIESDPQNSVFPVGLDSPGTPKLDVDALASKLASLEVVDTIEKSHARRVSDGSTTGLVRSPEYKEVMLEGGGVHMLTMNIKKIGTAIVWEFSTEPKGIAFGIWYKEKKESQKEDEVLPLKRCLSHKATLTGEYISQKTGVYVLKFDNCHSKYTGRKLLYKVWTRSPL